MFDVLSQKNEVNPQGGSKVSQFLSGLRGKIVDLLGYKQAKQQDSEMFVVGKGEEYSRVKSKHVHVHGRAVTAQAELIARVEKGGIVGNLTTEGLAEVENATVENTVKGDQVNTNKKAKIYDLRAKRASIQGGSKVENITISKEGNADIDNSKVGEIRGKAKIVYIRAGSRVGKIIGADVVNVENGAEVDEIIGTNEVIVAKGGKTGTIENAQAVFHQGKAKRISGKDVYYTGSSANATISIGGVGSIGGKADFITTRSPNIDKPTKGAQITAFGKVNTISSGNPYDEIKLDTPAGRVDMYMPTDSSFQNVKNRRGIYRGLTDPNSYEDITDAYEGFREAQEQVKTLKISPDIKGQRVNYYNREGFRKAA